MEAKEYLRRIIYTRKELDDWFTGKAFPLVKYDGELGWLFRSGRFRDGVDGSITTYNFDKLGPRRMTMYADEPCRINTYGNSFTECHQVSDGETWQEILAAHLCEPIRNFGIGGYSVYQAYLRMKREETRTPAKYIIFNIYDDDHYRNLSAWENIRKGKSLLESTYVSFINPPKPFVTANPEKEEFKEHGNPCPSLKSL
jgi:hypothetical protein